MPELPEVETVRLQLLHHVVGKTIVGVEVFHSKTVGHDTTIEDTLVGKTIEHIDRVGKLMIISFVGESDIFLLAHLKMTGQFFFVDRTGVQGGGHSMTEADVRDLPHKHTRLALHFTDHATLYFNDMRLFGYVKVATAAEVAKARGQFGPEPIDEQFDVDDFVTRVRKRKTPIKAALLDQSFVAGLGNIYVDEALWRAGVRPTRKANRLTKAEAAAIITAGGEVMRESIAVGGTTFQHFADTGGNNGNFTDYLKVFGKQGTACERCGERIKKIRCAGRGTHYCPNCQR
ncbi:MAG TPA: bifunctional DNA-formamidopyrimidine glycosylase/DNA-(apurinic or apyrimidinic site) lyase [Candidatus Paceibacterota bacterium]|nr:bifunctional DNA-formamidopyrimidine glycosylase/DNA-(apurinic or apyrimidinic site) lyase [Candidatus Paceibacterota bacterium]